MFYTLTCWIFGAAMLVLCAIIALDDMKTSYIRNRYIITGFKLCALALLLHLVVSTMSYYMPWMDKHMAAPVARKFAEWVTSGAAKSLAFSFYPVYLLHSLCAAALGVFIWKFGFWPAGDAKFFILLSAAMPLVWPQSGLFPKALVAVFLMNIFMPAAVFFVLSLAFALIFASLRTEEMGELKPAVAGLKDWYREKVSEFRAKPIVLLFLAVNYFVLFSLSQVLRMYAHGGLLHIIKSDFAIFIFLFFVWDKMYRLMMRKSTTIASLVIMGAYLVVGSLFWPDRIASDLLKGMGMVLQFGMLLMLLKSFVQNYFITREIIRVPVEDLCPGMILASSAEASLKADHAFYREHFSDNYSDGLAAAQIAKLQGWERESCLEICQTKPFALWILIGAVLTVWLQNDILHWAVRLFSSVPKTGGGLL